LASETSSTHVDFIGALFVIWGALTILIGASTLALGVGAATVLRSSGREARHFAAGLMAAVFVALAVIAVVWGLAHIAVGLPLRRRRHWSRLAALMLGSIDLLLLPYGTALGGYALWILLKQDSKRLFEPVGQGAHAWDQQPGAVEPFDHRRHM
jgi:hypothetical protein